MKQLVWCVVVKENYVLTFGHLGSREAPELIGQRRPFLQEEEHEFR